jgi:superfamily I DNA/RNA helicase
MGPFELARYKARELRLKLFSNQASEAIASGELLDAAISDGDLLIVPVPFGHSSLQGSDALLLPSRATIRIRNDVKSAERAFLLAHEVGHTKLHIDTDDKDVPASLASIAPQSGSTQAARSVESYGTRERDELQANVFAREFLCPREVARMLFLEKRLGAKSIAKLLDIPEALVRLQLYDSLLLPDFSPETPRALPSKPTDDQLPAVMSVAQTSLVKAGPGTGKTTALMFRIKHLLEGGADPASLLVLTFSNKAARELVERLKATKLEGVEKMWVGTFHAFGLQFLRKFGHIWQLPPDVRLVDGADALALIETVLDKVSLSEFDSLRDPVHWLDKVVDAIFRCKDELVSAEEYAEAVEAETGVPEALQQKRRDCAAIYSIYDAELKRRGWIDLPDLLRLTVEALKSENDAVGEYRRSFKHVLVDEYQDINRASACLVRELSRESESRWVVGDRDQAIYRFRGASLANLVRFEDDYPEFTAFSLTENHRSSSEIVGAFAAVLQHRAESGAQSLKSADGASAVKPCRVKCSDELQLAAEIHERVAGLNASGVVFRQQAVIAPTHALCGAVGAYLTKQGVPVLHLGNVFERQCTRQLLSVLQLAADSSPAALIGVRTIDEFRMSEADVTAVQVLTKGEGGVDWRQAKDAALNPEARKSFARLRRCLRGFGKHSSPDDVLANLLFERTDILRRMANDSSTTADNERLAIWQFIQFCRSPDELRDFPTIAGLLTRIKRRVLLGQDRDVRAVPPEADGIDAVKILTIHQSKGLEFDAIHIVGLTAEQFTASDEKTGLVPRALLSSSPNTDAKAEDQIECDNKLYVALSRAKKWLYVYEEEAEPSAEQLVSASSHFDTRTAGGAALVRERPVQVSGHKAATVTFNALAEFQGCPKRYDFSYRLGLFPYSNKPGEAVCRTCVKRALRLLPEDVAALDPQQLDEILSAAVDTFRLKERPQGERLVQRAEEHFSRAVKVACEPGWQAAPSHTVELDGLLVELPSHQVSSKDKTVRRFIFPKKLRTEQEQVLKVLRDQSKQAAGRAEFLVGTWDGSEAVKLGNVRAPTAERIRNSAQRLMAGDATPVPKEFTCPMCPHYFYCTATEA